MESLIKKLSFTGNPMIDGLIIAQLSPLLVNAINNIINLIKFIFTIVIKYFLDYLYNRIYVSIEIKANYFVYSYIVELISNNMNEKLSGLLLFDVIENNARWYETIIFRPKDNKYINKLVKFRNKYIWIRIPTDAIGFTKNSNDPIIISTLSYGVTKEFLTSYLKDLGHKYKFKSTTELVTRIKIYRYINGDWKKTKIPKRKYDTVYLPSSIKEDIMQDITDFEKKSEFYYERGLSYQRGYLLYGPPGTGKSSLAKLIASHLDYDIRIINLKDMTLDDNKFNELIIETSDEKVLYLFEDIDQSGLLDKEDNMKDDMGIRNNINMAAYVSFMDHSSEKSDKKETKGFEPSIKRGITYSGFINTLSGISNMMNGSIIVMTTNHKDKLPPSLIRRGRIDKIYYVGNMEEANIKDMTKDFMDNITTNKVNKFTKLLLEKHSKIIPSRLQGYLMEQSSKTLIKNLDKY